MIYQDRVLRGCGIGMNFALLCEHDDVESYVHAYTRHYLWPDYFPAPPEYGQGKQQLDYIGQLEKEPWQHWMEANYIQEYLCHHPAKIARLVTKLAHRIPLRKLAIKFLHRLCRQRVQVLIYSPGVIGYNLLSHLVIGQLGCNSANYFCYRTNGLARNGKKWVGWYNYPSYQVDVKRPPAVLRLYSPWYTLSDNLFEAKQLQQVLPGSFTIGCADPSDFKARARWERYVDDLTTRSDIFRHCLALR